MSDIEPLDPDILEGEGIEADSGLWILLRRLNRATDRINELEAKYSEHTHDVHASVDPDDDFATTPPTNNGTRGGASE